MTRLLWVAALAVAGAASAASFRSGDRIVVPRGEVLEDDLYAFGSSVVVEGEVRGDVVAFGGEVRVPGRVQGDLLTAAQDLRVDGAVDGSVRGAARRMALGGTVGKDAVVAGETIDLASQASVAGDVAAAGATVRLEGAVGRNVWAGGGQVALDGTVGGHARAQADQVTVGERAVVQGGLEYVSNQRSTIPAGARVGEVSWKPTERRQPGVGSFFVGWIRLSIGLFALGLLAGWLAPKLAREAPAELGNRPWASLGAGAVALLAAPFAGALLFGLGLLLGGWWLAVLLFAAMLIAVSLAFPTVGLVVGEALVGRFASARGGTFLVLATGVVLLAFTVRLPFIGAAAVLAAMMFGLGALLLAGWHLRQAARAAAAV